MAKKFESGPGNPGRATAFKKGQSGNPGGRPKTIAEVRDLARSYTVAAIDALVANLSDPSGAVRNAAAQTLLERGWGKAPITAAGEGGEGDLKASITVTFVSPDGTVRSTP